MSRLYLLVHLHQGHFWIGSGSVVEYLPAQDAKGPHFRLLRVVPGPQGLWRHPTDGYFGSVAHLVREALARKTEVGDLDL